MNLAMQYAEEHFDDFINELKEILQIPSVSTDLAYGDRLTNSHSLI